MNSISTQINSVIHKEKLFTNNTPLLLSFSGGPDSVFLLKILLLLDYKNITLIYFNHHLRTKHELEKEITRRPACGLKTLSCSELDRREKSG